MKNMLTDLLGRAGRAMADLRRVAQRIGAEGYDASDPRGIADAVLFEVRRLGGDCGRALRLPAGWAAVCGRVQKERDEAKALASRLAERCHELKRERDEARAFAQRGQGDQVALLERSRSALLTLSGIPEDQVNDETWLVDAVSVIEAALHEGRRSGSRAHRLAGVVIDIGRRLDEEQEQGEDMFAYAHRLAQAAGALLKGATRQASGDAPEKVEPWSALVIFDGKRYGGGWKVYQAYMAEQPHWRCAGLRIEPGAEIDGAYWYLRCPADQQPEDEPDGSAAFEYSYAHSMTYLSDKMRSVLRLLIRASGLDPSQMLNAWSRLEAGISTWLQSGHLRAIVVEFYEPDNPGVASARWDFEVKYQGSGVEDDMWVDEAYLRRQFAKARQPTSRCTYRIVLSVGPDAPPVDGFENCEYLSLGEMVGRSIGTAIATPHLGAWPRYFRWENREAIRPVAEAEASRARAMGLRPTEDFDAFRPPLGAFDTPAEGRMQVVDYQPDGATRWEQQPGESPTDFVDRIADDAALLLSGADPEPDAFEPEVTLLGDSLGARMMRAMYAVPALLKLERDTERDELRGIPATWGAHGRRTKVELRQGDGGIEVVATYDTRIAGRREYRVIMEEYEFDSVCLRLGVPDVAIFSSQQKSEPGVLGRVLVDDFDDHDEVLAAVKRLIGAEGQDDG